MSCAAAHQLKAKYDVSPRVPLARFPEESLFLGSARAFTRSGLDFYQRCERIAGIVQTRFLWKPAYIITDPTAIADVLVNHPRNFIKPYTLRRLKLLFGNGLLTADGNQWTHHRHLMQPAFSAERISRFAEVVSQNTEEMVSSWRDGEVRNVYPELIDLCMKNVTETMFGVYDEELGSIVRALAATCHQLVRAVFDVIRPFSRTMIFQCCTRRSGSRCRWSPRKRFFAFRSWLGPCAQQVSLNWIDRIVVVRSKLSSRRIKDYRNP